MTLEEMAEAGYKSHTCEMGYNDGTRHKLYFDGFADGYSAAGNVIWHDLRKDPDDLPPRKGIETYSDRVITDKGYGVYNFRKCRWYVDEPDCDCMVHTEVVAWTEMPKFEEVEHEGNGRAVRDVL